MQKMRAKVGAKVHGAFDLSEWTLSAPENIAATLEAAVYDAAREALEIELDSEFYVTVPAYWAPRSDGYGGPPVADPLTLYLHFPSFGGSNDGNEGPVYPLSVADLLRDYMLDGEDGRPGCSASTARSLAAALHSLAAEFEAAAEKAE